MARALDWFLLRRTRILITAVAMILILGSAWMGNRTGADDYLYFKEEALAGNREESSKWGIETQGDGRGSTGSIDRMSGVDTMWSWEDPAGEELNLQWSLTTEKGYAKLVLVDGEGNLTTLAECAAGEKKEDSLTLSGLKGPVYLKLAAWKGAGPVWSVTADRGQWEDWTQSR